MSGFVLIFDQKKTLTPQTPVFVDFLESTVRYKYLDKPKRFVTGLRCVAAKLDAPSTLHKGIVEDKATGSWLLAVGTVIDSATTCPDGDLHQLLKDYLDQGDQVFDRLDGHFALIIYDRHRDSVSIASDPLGIISIFYAQKEDQFFISTSALAVAKAIQSKPSDFGVRYFILYGTVFGETTLWQDVKRVLPATILKLSQSGVTKYKYWSFELDQSVANLSLDETVDYVVEALSGVMHQGLSREDKIWVSLTGGFDSRTVAALTHYSNLPFKSYCHGPPDAKDVHIAAIISKKMGWDHEYFSLPGDWGRQRSDWLFQTLGQTDAHLDVFKTSRIIREQKLKAQQYKVSLWGFGGETYRGYHWKQEFLDVGTTSKVNYDRLLDYRMMPTVDWPILKDTTDWVQSIREELKAHFKAVGEQNNEWLNTIKLDLIGKYLAHAWSGAHISSALGLQRAMAPFDFKRGVVSVISTNYKWRTHDRLFRLILERTNPTLANIETADGGPALPMRLTNLYKFTPYWLGVSKKLAWGASRKFLGRELWQKKVAGTTGNAYPLAQWRRDTLLQLEEQDLLVPTKMHSAGLYNTNTLQTFVTQAQTDNFKHESLLSRVVTVEMALRSVDVSF